MRWMAGALAVLAVTIAPNIALSQAPPLWATVPEVPPLPRPDRSGFVDNDGAKLYFAVFHRHGGSPVILLHGGFASSDSWGFEVPLLAKTHEVIVMDTRGHGRSTLGPAPLSYRQFASDTLAVLDTVGAHKASVVGLSDGGITGLILAIEHPERVDRLFVWGATFSTDADPTGPPDPAMKGMGAVFMARMEAQYRALSPNPNGFNDLRASLVRLYGQEPSLTPAKLGAIKSPTIVADGAHEQFIAQAHTAMLAHLIPRAQLVILPNVSHGGPQQDPAAFGAAVASLLDRPE
ncbi:pimeloyl-ACP methyl ester carboxylesterase [Sphingomonas sp. BE270]|jgi:pimeloyl-ACP methyl ester carboxylesterase|uniref:alpha/beta fold hydrolase n=1 Tax=Sphingomonas sp. BE270 TaxID=2817726 RepID=UPI0028650BDB|nr:alpha/beta hydrolase [Sphingomonas sp. BE270]MDR7256386.1 pimeloyl-ACP methyl ester carboxylesterase [Sphingomonas sp. BE270]